MAVRKHLFSLFSLLSLALVLASFQSTSANALSLEYHQHHARSLHQHNLLAKKRSTKQKRCKSRPTPSSAPVPVSSPASKQAAAAAGSASPAPAKQSSAAPPPPPSSSPKPQSSAPAPAPPQSTSSSSVAQRLKDIFPNKYLGAFGGSPTQLLLWNNLDAYYNWNVQPTGQGGPMFIATLWGKKNQASWKANVLDASTPPLIVKTYNEAELPSQANLSPQDAATFWNANVLPLAGKSIIGCPAVTSDPGAPDWLTSFIASCNNGHENCACDFLDVHFYGTDAASFISWIQNMQKQFPMPMMISEFACQSFTDGPQCNPQQVNEFATTMTQFFQSTDYIFAFAPFGMMQDLGNVNSDNGLMNADGSPNSLAHIYYPKI